MIELYSLTPEEQAAEAADVVTLFSIDGVEYKIPRRFKAAISLRYMRMVRTEGAEQALAYMLETVLGTEAYEALMNLDSLTQENLQQIGALVHKLVMGELKAPKVSTSST